MSGIQKRQLADGTDVIWTVPLSGMGHVADEQPQPYLQRSGLELTPRFGGEERHPQSGLTSLPFPYGYLTHQWPWRQRLFNLPRRRVNIYWRNLFKDPTRADRLFHFLEQLEYCETGHGYRGSSPSVNYQRSFKLTANTIEVNDAIEFKDKLHFSELYLCPWAEFQANDMNSQCLVVPSMVANHSHPISSSTGTAIWHAHKLIDVKYKKGDRITWAYTYHIK